MKRPMANVRTGLALAMMATLGLAACDSKSPNTGKSGTTGTGGHAQEPGDGHSHGGHSHGGAVIALGEQTIADFAVSVTRDEGQVVAGKDVAIDATVTPKGAAKVVAVRFWVGTQDAAGSVKAKADIENPKTPTVWHTHADVPNPIPPESRLWVEVEDDSGAKSAGAFDLK